LFIKKIVDKNRLLSTTKKYSRRKNWFYS